MKVPSILATSLALLLAGCSPSPVEPQAASQDASDPLATEQRGHAANVPDAAPSPPGREPAPALDAVLESHAWQLESATAREGTAIDAFADGTGAPLTLDFGDGEVVVTNACNPLRGAFTLDAGALAFEPLVGTEKACADAPMAMEREARIRLSGRHALEHVPGDPPRLRLVDGRGDVLVFAGTPKPRGG